MAMVLKSNVSGTTIANPDGWTPPFSMEGLLYAGIYGRGDLAKNYAPGGADAVVYGSPVVTDHFATLSSSNYLDTGVPTSKTATLIAVVRKTITANRQFVISSYKQSNYGKSLLIDPPNAKLITYSHYKGVDGTGAPVSTPFASAFVLNNADGRPTFIASRDTGKKLILSEMTDNRTTGNTATENVESYVDSTLKYKIGYGNAPDIGAPVPVAAAMIYDRPLSDTELQAVYQYFVGYFERRGISIGITV